MSTTSSQANPSVRYEWYQTETQVVITVFAKNATDQTKIEFKETSIVMNISTLKESELPALTLNLRNKIDPVQSTFKILNTKIELHLIKQSPAGQWETLESTSKLHPQPMKKKNWDSLTNELLTTTTTKEDEGDAALMKLFQDIYSKADGNTKRAMMKSYVESNGTTLSTSWDEVGSKRVETKPPQGMVAKPYTQ